MYTAYLDGSGGGHKDVFVLGGYIATDVAWASFSDEWRQLLEREPKLDSFKMSHMAQTESRMMRAEEFYRLIEKHVAGYVGCVIYTDELIEAEARVKWPPNYFNQQVIRNPYFSAFHSIIRQLVEYQPEIGINEPIQLVFDTQTEMKTVLDTLDYQILSTPVRFHGLLTNPRFEDDQTTLPLQAADLYSWWTRRWAIERRQQKDKQFAWPRNKHIHGILIEMDGHHFSDLFDRLLSEDSEMSLGLADLMLGKND